MVEGGERLEVENLIELHCFVMQYHSMVNKCFQNESEEKLQQDENILPTPDKFSPCCNFPAD